MDTSASAALSTVVNQALSRQQLSLSALKQQGQTVTAIVGQAVQAGGSALPADGSRGTLVNTVA